MIEQQVKRELEFRDNAIVRYKELQERAMPSATAAGAQIVDTEARVELVCRGIEAMVSRYEEGKTGGGNPGIAVKYLSMLEAWPVAILTMRVGFNAGVEGMALTRAAMKLASALHDQYQFDLLAQEALGLVIHLEKKHKRRAAGNQKATIIRHACKYVGVKPLEWADGDKLKVGAKLLEILMDSTGLIVSELKRTSPTRTTQVLDLTPEAREWYENANDKAANVLASDLRATIIPPKPWTTPLDGGYYSKELRVDLMRHTMDGPRDDLFSTDPSVVYKAVNSVPSTALRLKATSLTALHQCLKNGSDVRGLAHAHP